MRKRGRRDRRGKRREERRAVEKGGEGEGEKIEFQKTPKFKVQATKNKQARTQSMSRTMMSGTLKRREAE